MAVPLSTVPTRRYMGVPVDLINATGGVLSTVMGTATVPLSSARSSAFSVSVVGPSAAVSGSQSSSLGSVGSVVPSSSMLPPRLSW
jgi:hypothetical protein